MQDELRTGVKVLVITPWSGLSTHYMQDVTRWLVLRSELGAVQTGTRPGEVTQGCSIFSSAVNRLIGEVVQSMRRPLLGPSPGWKRLLRHYAEQALTPRSLNVKLGPRHNYHKGRVAIRHYANQPTNDFCVCVPITISGLVGAFNQEKALVGAFSVIVKTGCGTDGSFYSTSPDTFWWIVCEYYLVLDIGNLWS